MNSRIVDYPCVLFCVIFFFEVLEDFGAEAQSLVNVSKAHLKLLKLHELVLVSLISDALL